MLTLSVLGLCGFCVLLHVTYQLKVRVIDLERQMDADREFVAWEAGQLRAMQERLLDTAVHCQKRHVDATWREHEREGGAR